MSYEVGDRVLATEPCVHPAFTISPETVGIIIEVKGTRYVVFWGHPDGFEYEFLPRGIKRALREHDLGPVEKSFPFEPPWMAEIEQFLRVG